MAGTNGTNVQVGDPGIANFFGNTLHDVGSISGSGSAVYSTPLTFMPAVTATPYVATSGKTIACTFNAISNNSVATPTQTLIAPTISKNGTSLGSLINPWVTGHHNVILYSLPAGTSVGPSDVVTLTAPNGWMNTNVGIVGGMTNLVIDNRTGRSSVGTDKLRKTFKPGWNNAHLAVCNWSTYQVGKNWAKRADKFFGAVQLHTRHETYPIEWG